MRSRFGRWCALGALALAALPAGDVQAAEPPAGFFTTRVFATQYNPHASGSAEVAVPDKCAKFAALGWSSTLQSQGCPSGYGLAMDWRVHVKRDSGQSAFFGVRDVGPWNVDDNYWNPPSGPRPRRLFTDLPQGKPQAQAAFQDGHNTVPDCKRLDGTSSGASGPADQFGRCVRNPAGIDLSVEAARQLGLAHLQNEWVTVTFMWEPDGSSPSPTPRPPRETEPPPPTGAHTLTGTTSIERRSAWTPRGGITVCADAACVTSDRRSGSYRLSFDGSPTATAGTARGSACTAGPGGPTSVPVSGSTSIDWHCPRR